MKVNSELERVKLSHRNLQTKVNTLEVRLYIAIVFFYVFDSIVFID